jgi:hypothetical protein
MVTAWYAGFFSGIVRDRILCSHARLFLSHLITHSLSKQVGAAGSLGLKSL